MAKYYKQATLIEYLNENVATSEDGFTTMDCVTLAMLHVPTADVVEMKHGKWVKHMPDKRKMQKFHRKGIGLGMSQNSIFWTCSCCDSWGSITQNYCPNCGAKMDWGVMLNGNN